MNRTPFEDELIDIIHDDAPPPQLTRWRNPRITSTRPHWRPRFAALGAAAATMGVVAVTGLVFVATSTPHTPPVAAHTAGPTSAASPGLPTGSVNPSSAATPAATTTVTATSHGSPATPRVVPGPPITPSSTIWSPAAVSEWQIENDHPLDPSNGVDMGTSTGSGPVTTYNGSIAPAPQVYEIDAFDNPASTVAALHARGLRAVCNVDVGTLESGRPDASSFPSSLLGNSNGSGERWLDIRQLSALEPPIASRLQMCKSKGFDAVDPDNVDGYTNNTGFPLTAQDQLTYNTWVAQEAHSIGLGVALHNDNDQAAQLAGSFDFAVDEQCFQYTECQPLVDNFAAHGKAVFEIEYSSANFCPQSNSWNFSAMSAPSSLDGTRTPCR